MKPLAHPEQIKRVLAPAMPWRAIAPLLVVLAAISSVAAQPDRFLPNRSGQVEVGGPPDSPFEAVLDYELDFPDIEATATTETSLATTSSTKPGPTTTRPGAKEVMALQVRLAELGYDIGKADGVMGGRTAHTILAFQKVEGLKRTGADSPELRAALSTASRPSAMVPGGASTRIEVDLTRQVLFHWRGGQLVRILSISSGNGEKYCVKGACDIAVTPPGSFRIGRKAAGLEVAPLGELWWPMYFNGGIAIHGSPSVPAYPASHGCIRIPMYAAPTLFEQVDRGTSVILVGRGPGPEGARAVPPPEPPPSPQPVVEPPPDEPPATTSTLPETVTTEAERPTTSSSTPTTRHPLLPTTSSTSTTVEPDD